MKKTNPRIISLIIALIFTVGIFGGYTVTVQALSNSSKVYISSISNLSKTIYKGTKFTLPSYVAAVMSNKTSKSVSVKWNINSVSTSKVGKFSYYGTVAGYSRKITYILSITNPPASKPMGLPAPLSANGELNTTKIYSGIGIFDMLTKMGYHRSVPLMAGYWQQELGALNTPNSIYFEVRNGEFDFKVGMEKLNNQGWKDFRTLCDLLLPGYGEALYKKINSQKDKEITFNIGGRNIKSIFINNVYDIFFSPYNPGSVKVLNNRTYTGDSLLPKIVDMGFFRDSKYPETLRTNPYGQDGAVQFEEVDVSSGAGIGPWDVQMIIFWSDAEMDAKLKKIFNMILPTKVNTLYKVLDDAKLKPQTLNMDGRRIDIEVYNWGICVEFTPIIQ